MTDSTSLSSELAERRSIVMEAFHYAWGYANEHPDEHRHGYDKKAFAYVHHWLEVSSARGDSMGSYDERPHSPVPRRQAWQPIATVPKDVREYRQRALFWLDWADDCATINPPMSFERRTFLGLYGQWSSVNKATHWQPQPAAPLTKEAHFAERGQRAADEQNPSSDKARIAELEKVYDAAHALTHPTITSSQGMGIVDRDKLWALHNAVARVAR